MSDNNETVTKELTKRQRAMIEHALVWLADSDDDHYGTEELHDTAEYVAYGESEEQE